MRELNMKSSILCMQELKMLDVLGNLCIGKLKMMKYAEKGPIPLSEKGAKVTQNGDHDLGPISFSRKPCRTPRPRESENPKVCKDRMKQ